MARANSLVFCSNVVCVRYSRFARPRIRGHEAKKEKNLGQVQNPTTRIRSTQTFFAVRFPLFSFVLFAPSSLSVSALPAPVSSPLSLPHRPCFFASVSASPPLSLRLCLLSSVPPYLLLAAVSQLMSLGRYLLADVS
jgi:hypothetical protein